MFYLITIFLLFISFGKMTAYPFYVGTVNSSSKVLIFSCLDVINQRAESRWDYFFAAAFDFPRLLEIAKQSNLPVVLVCPKELEGISPIDNFAPFIEGARVALAWASTYFRFHNVDVRVVLTNANENLSVKLSNIVSTGLKKSILDTDKPEESFKNRMYLYQNVDKKVDLEITINTFKIPEQTEIISTIHPRKNCSSQKKRVIITGGAGFLGSHLARSLINAGYYVIALDSLICASKDNINDLIENENFEFHQIDVAKPYDILGPIHLIAHLASVPSPEFYYRLPNETLTSGLQGIKNSLDVAVQKNAKFIFSSTSEVYGDPHVSPQSEEYAGNVNPWGKRSQYDESKRGAETICKWYFERYGLDMIIARIFNTYGPVMSLNDGRAVTNFIRSVLKQQPMIIYGNGNQTRSFCFVSDLIDGLMLLLKSQDNLKKERLDDRIFNLGNDQEFTINELAHKINDLSDYYHFNKVAIEHIENPDVTDPKLRRPDLRKIKYLGYNPSTNLETGLKRTLEYFINK